MTVDKEKETNKGETGNVPKDEKANVESNDPKSMAGGKRDSLSQAEGTDRAPDTMAFDNSKDDKDDAPIIRKKAKIAMPPPVASSLVNVDKYQLDDPTSNVDSTSKKCEEDEEAIANKIVSPCLILFGLHPLIREPPLKKMCEDYGTVRRMTVRSAFANRYGHVEFETVEEARACYRALNGAKLLHKAILVQPGKAEINA